MNKILITFLTFASLNLLAQVPQGVGYQGVATDSEGIELVNQSISIRASVLSGSANGTIEWEETHATSTDTFGLFNITIGQGNSSGNGVQVNFADISWGSATHFLKIEMDVTGGNNYTFMGTNQMMSVPYALYAESANINYDSISNLLSNDSTFITNVGGGTGGGGCDYSFPEGLEGDMIPWDLSNGNDYTVPAGKNLFITNIHTNDGSSFRIDGVRVLDEKWGISNTSNNDEIGMLRHPLCVKSGQVISASTNSTYKETFYGVLTDAVVEPISFWFDNVGSGNESYTVPNGKKLVVTNIWMYGSSNSDLTIDGVVIAAENFNKPEAFSNKYIEIPLIVESGSIISIPNNYSSFNGYLVDEDYFADCGGGGSSNSNNDNSINNILNQLYLSDELY